MIGEIIACKIIDIKSENSVVKSFYLEPVRPIEKPRPGQFFMVWVPNYEEIPISASGYEDGIIRISVAAVGETTERLHRARIGEYLGLKGPLGNGIKIEKKKYLLVGGGYGVAPLLYAMKEIANVGGESTIIIGARNKEFLLMISEAKELGNVIVATDDGSAGIRGTAVDAAEILIKKDSFDEILVCGPKPMLVKMAKICVESKISCKIFAEAYMQCGLGLCGSCVLGNSGLLVCRDGPVFSAEVFLDALGDG